MKMKTYSFYRAIDGRFTGREFSAVIAKHIGRNVLAQNTPEGCIAIEGRYDRFSQRVDLATGKVIDDKTLGTRCDLERRRNATLLQIAELERRQLRPTRELLSDPGNAEAKRRLVQLDDEIAKVRTQLLLGG